MSIIAYSYEYENGPNQRNALKQQHVHRRKGHDYGTKPKFHLLLRMRATITERQLSDHTRDRTIELLNTH